MSKHTPGPYTVERAVGVGRRGGKRYTGWKVMRDGKIVKFCVYKASAQESADMANRVVAAEARDEALRCGK